MVRICIQMLRIPFEWFEFALECFESLSNGSNLHSNSSNVVRMVRICSQMLRIPFKWFEFAFECFESRLKGSNLHSNDLNHFRMVRIYIRMLRIWFEWLEFAFECLKLFRMVRICIRCFESLSNGLNLHSNVSNLV